MTRWDWNGTKVWKRGCTVLAVVVGVQSLWIQALTTRVDLLTKYAALQERWCAGLQRVNEVCEGQFVEVMQRLGLDSEMMPLVSTALYKRATTVPVAKAREKLGAKRVAKSLLERGTAMGGSDD